MKKRILALLLALTLLVLGGCTVRDMVQVVGVSIYNFAGAGGRRPVG